MNTERDISHLDREQLAQICGRYEELIQAQVVANNAMLLEMQSSDDVSNPVIDILNKWSRCMNELHEAWANGVEAATTPFLN